MGTVRRDRLELPLEALQGRETGSDFGRHEGIVLHVMPAALLVRQSLVMQVHGLRVWVKATTAFLLLFLKEKAQCRLVAVQVLPMLATMS